MGEIIPQFPVLMQISNDERHDAAITIAELSRYDPLVTGQMLEMMGLADRDAVDRLRACGGDEYELSWFTPRRRPASGR